MVWENHFSQQETSMNVYKYQNIAEIRRVLPRENTNGFYNIKWSGLKTRKFTLNRHRRIFWFMEYIQFMEYITINKMVMDLNEKRVVHGRM